MAYLFFFIREYHLAIKSAFLAANIAALLLNLLKVNSWDQFPAFKISFTDTPFNLAAEVNVDAVLVGRVYV